MTTLIEKLMPSKWRENYAYNRDEADAMAQDYRRNYLQVSVRYVESKDVWLVRFRLPR